MRVVVVTVVTVVFIAGVISGVGVASWPQSAFFVIGWLVFVGMIYVIWVLPKSRAKRALGLIDEHASRVAVAIEGVSIGPNDPMIAPDEFLGPGTLRLTSHGVQISLDHVKEPRSIALHDIVSVNSAPAIPFPGFAHALHILTTRGEVIIVYLLCRGPLCLLPASKTSVARVATQMRSALDIEAGP